MKHTFFVWGELGAIPNEKCKIVSHPADVTGGFNALYMHMDIVEHQLLGD